MGHFIVVLLYAVIRLNNFVADATLLILKKEYYANIYSVKRKKCYEEISVIIYITVFDTF